MFYFEVMACFVKLKNKYITTEMMHSCRNLVAKKKLHHLWTILPFNWTLICLLEPQYLCSWNETFTQNLLPQSGTLKNLHMHFSWSICNSQKLLISRSQVYTILQRACQTSPMIFMCLKFIEHYVHVTTVENCVEIAPTTKTTYPHMPLS